MDRHDNILLRIVSLLLSLAALAEHAAGWPTPARRALLWLLRPAEARARRMALDLAAELGWIAFAPAPHFSRHCDQPRDALRMARSLAVVAELIDTLLYRGACWTGASGARWRLLSSLASIRGSFFAAKSGMTRFAPAILDTS